MDLALCSLSGAVSASVVPAIADRKGVLVSINLPTLKLHVIERTVWVYKNANWEGLTNSLKEFDFADILAKDIDSAVESFVEVVLSKANQFIPTPALREVKGIHPWLTDKCRAAIVFKHSREGTSDYKDASELCTQEFRLAYAGYVDAIRAELRDLPKGSKQWWSLSKVLMENLRQNQI